MFERRDDESDFLEVNRSAGHGSGERAATADGARTKAGGLKGWLHNLFSGGEPDIILHSRLSPVALAEKLRAIFGSGGSAMPVDHVIGHGSEQQMALFVSQNGNSGGVRYFTADLEAHGSGTRILGRFEKNPALKWVPVIFLVVGTIFLIAGIGMLFAGDVPIMLPLMFIGMPLFQWVFLFFVMKMLKGKPVQEEQIIRAFLNKYCEVE